MNVVYEGVAPGRMDVMGGIADYSGSLVLQMAIHHKTTVRLLLHDHGYFRVTSDNNGAEPLHVEIRMTDVLVDGRVDYTAANRFFRSNPQLLWAGYVVGCALVLQREKGAHINGCDFTISSDVPIGKGVSSSASLEVATMKALGQALNVRFDGTELPILAQKVENLIVGAPCGLMDQLATCFGEPYKLLPIICQPDRVLPLLHVGTPLHFVGIDSGVRHAVSGSDYGDVRCAAFMGYTIIAQSLGLSRKDIESFRRTGDREKLPYRGYLCNISIDEFEQRFRQLLPTTMRGQDFIGLFGDTIDSLSTIHPKKMYQVADCCGHPVYENARVHEFVKILSLNNLSEDDHLRLGQLMYQSHESYSRCGLGSERTDEIVQLARAAHNNGVMGAKITGGGSGGTVCLLVSGKEGLKEAKQIHSDLERKYQKTLVFFD